MPRASLRKAFTLVELLVVIGIIAVLIAILMPALQTARAQAKSIACQANLHSITQAVFEYANDYNGALVPANWYGNALTGPYGSTATTGWWEAPASDAILLGKYVDGPSCTNGFGGVMKRSIFTCPEKNWGESPNDVINRSTCYAMDQWGYAGTGQDQRCPVIEAASGAPLTDSGWEYEYKLASVRSPSQMLCFVCSTSERFFDFSEFTGNPGNEWSNYGWSGAIDSNYNLALRHPNHSTNVSFMDGHVENIQATLHTANISPTGTSATAFSLYSAWQRGDFVVSPDK